MTKIDVFSGFLGAGKTTLIRKLIKEAYAGEKLVLIENEFGEIGIDGGFMKDAGIAVNEINSGCICCSLVGDFGKALQQVMETYHPDRILIEPSGVGKLSDVVRAVQKADLADACLNGFTTVADANKCRLYIKNFGEFYNDQIEHAGTIILSHTGHMTDEKIAAAVALLREHNKEATIITTDWDKLSGKQILEAMERKDTLQAEMDKLLAETQESEHHHHHHDHDDDDDECCCGHHHDEDEEHEHHHHDHDDDDDDECCCGHHHDGEGHHHHHHADEVFTSFGVETTKKFTKDEIRQALETLVDDPSYGMVLRAKGIVEGTDGNWIHFDYVPGEPDVRDGGADIIGRLCVIGAKLDKAALSKLFGV